MSRHSCPILYHNDPGSLKKANTESLTKKPLSPGTRYKMYENLGSYGVKLFSTVAPGLFGTPFIAVMLLFQFMLLTLFLFYNLG